MSSPALAPAPFDAPAATAPPWTWPWYRWAPGEGWTFFWIALIHALSVVGLVLFPLPGWPVVAAAFGIFWLGGLGTTVAYHRALSHRAVKLHPVVEVPLVFFALLNGSGTPATWAANHRLHHAKAETEGDISSPRLGGFWWAHLRWLWQAQQAPVAKWAPDMDGPLNRFLMRAQIPLLALSLVAGGAFGWAAFFWLGPIRLAFALHAQCVTNSVLHLRPDAAPGEDSSVNRWWLAPMQGLLGENWHRNHHDVPWSARFGQGPAQVDLGWGFIRAAEAAGLATDVRRPRAVRPVDAPPQG